MYICRTKITVRKIIVALNIDINSFSLIIHTCNIQCQFNLKMENKMLQICHQLHCLFQYCVFSYESDKYKKISEKSVEILNFQEIKISVRLCSPSKLVCSLVLGIIHFWNIMSRTKLRYDIIIGFKENKTQTQLPSVLLYIRRSNQIFQYF